jgi:putative endonuclease
VKKQPTVYILASKKDGVLYIGVTSKLIQRVWQHKQDVLDGFTKKYRIHKLVYCEFHTTMLSAIAREKQLKWWKRTWKVELIEGGNPDWRDLYEELLK